MSKRDFTLDAEPGEYTIQGADADVTVERVLDEVRLALLGILLSIGLAVGFGVPGPWYAGVAWGVAATVIAAAAFRWPRSHRSLARLMHWILDR